MNNINKKTDSMLSNYYEDQIGFTIAKKENKHLKELVNFLDNNTFETPKKSQYTNFTDLRTGKTYAIINDEASKTDNIKFFFDKIESCRRNNINMSFMERQYFKLENEIVMDEFDFDQEDYEMSCMDFDFDIYLKEEFKIDESIHMRFIQILCEVLNRVLDWESTEVFDSKNSKIKFYVAILQKPQRIQDTRQLSGFNKYGKCWKESFHIRVFLKLDKNTKLLIRQEILKSNDFQELFSQIPMINNIEDAFDRASLVNPILLYGSTKHNSNEFHGLDKLFHIEFRTDIGMPIILPKYDLNPIYQNPVEVKVGRSKKMVKPKPAWNYNLVLELSVHYSGDLINKPRVYPQEDLHTDLREIGDQVADDLLSDIEINNMKNSLTDICKRDFNAAYIYECLKLLDIKRVEDYDSWKEIILILARENPDYFQLAVSFSSRCPASFQKGAIEQIEGLFKWAQENSSEQVENPKTISTIYYWAKQDNPEGYRKVQNINLFSKLQKIAYESCGEISQIAFAILLKKMFAGKFKCNDDPKKNNTPLSSRIWREFVFPEDDRARGEVYKWRKESGHLDTLHNFIAKQLPKIIQQVMEFSREFQEKKHEELIVENPDKAERNNSYHNEVVKGLRKTLRNLGSMGFINGIMSACRVEFRIGNRDFEKQMNECPSYLGTQNGVLQLRPITKLIQHYHEIPISKSCNVNYLEYDPNNIYIKRLETVFMEILEDDPEVYEYIMVFLASGLDGHDKNDGTFLQLVGDGSQGKTVFAEFDQQTKGDVRKEGYATKLNVGWLTTDRKTSSHDTDLASLNGSRSVWGSESEGGETLKMGKLKEVLSENISTSDKNEKTEVFRVQSHIITTSNNEYRIDGRDYGTWRRIKFYKFKRYFLFEDKYDPNDPNHRKANADIKSKWPYQREYQEAYLSILVKYYEIFRDKYNGIINKVPCEKINRETIDYAKRQDKITEFVCDRILHVGKKFKDGKDVPKISITEIVGHYINWYIKKYGNDKFSKSDIGKWISEHYHIKKFIYQSGGKSQESFLTEHRILEAEEILEDIEDPQTNPHEKNNIVFDEYDY